MASIEDRTLTAGGVTVTSTEIEVDINEVIHPGFHPLGGPTRVSTVMFLPLSATPEGGRITIDARCSKCLPHRRLAKLVGVAGTLLEVQYDPLIGLESNPESEAESNRLRLVCHPSCGAVYPVRLHPTLEAAFTKAVEKKRKVVWLPRDLQGLGRLSHQ